MAKNITENQNNNSNPYLNELKRGLSVVENKEREINSRKIIENNKIKEIKGRLVKQLFSILQDNGVDPGDRESINNFLSKLSEQDPDLLTMFEIGFNNLQQEDVVNSSTENQGQQGIVPGKDISNSFSNLRNKAFNRG